MEETNSEIEDGDEIMQDAIQVVTTKQNKINVLYPGITIEKFRQSLMQVPEEHRRISQEIQEIIAPITSNEQEIPVATITKLCQYLQDLEPKVFGDIVFLYQLTCGAFLLPSDDYFIPRMQLIHNTFSVNTAKWNSNPVHLHVLTKALYKMLDNDQNLIFFARKIHIISVMGFNVSLCLMWALIQRILGREFKMFRMYEFKELVQMLLRVDVEILKEDPQKVYTILQVASFIETVVLAENNKTQISKTFIEFFKYKNDDLIKLRDWCTTLNKIFAIKLTQGQTVSEDTILINEIIEFDIIPLITNIIPVNNKFS